MWKKGGKQLHLIKSHQKVQLKNRFENFLTLMNKHVGFLSRDND